MFPCVYREHVAINSSIHIANRFIPMYIGNIKFIKAGRSESTVYPCVYREHIEQNTKNKNAYGLSLCIQGTLRYHQRTTRRWRFIPVYTGNIDVP